MEELSAIPVWLCIPFAGLLLSIAVMPLIKPDWWEKHQPLAVAFWSVLFIVPFAAKYGMFTMGETVLECVVNDYLTFIILLFGLLLGGICKKLRLPSLIGMLAVGIIIGPYALNLIDTSILEISAQLRKIALIIILARAGLSLNVSELKKVGRPAIMMCFVPACFEIIGMILLAPKLLGISVVDAAVMGTVVGAVSPAVIVPKMLNLIENGYGKDKSIPQLILAGASVDDVFVIVLFSAFLGLSQTGDMSAVSFVKIPISIVLGITVGIFVGIVLGKFFAKAHIRDTVKIIILMCVSFLLVAFEDTYGGIVPFSSLIAVMCIGISLQKVRKEATERLS
mgnify:FL=1